MLTYFLSETPHKKIFPFMLIILHGWTFVMRVVENVIGMRGKTSKKTLSIWVRRKSKTSDFTIGEDDASIAVSSMPKTNKKKGP